MNKKVLFAFFLSFVLLFTVVIINRDSFNSMKEYTVWLNHSREVMSRLEKLSNHFKSAQIYSPQYANTTNKAIYDLYKQDADSVKSEVAKLQWLVVDNPEQKKRMDTIGKLISVVMPLLLEKNILEITEMGSGETLEKIFVIQSNINEGIKEEKELLSQRSDDLEKSTMLTSLLTFLFSIIALIIILVTFIFNVLLSRKRQWLEGFLESILDTSQNGIITYKAMRDSGKITDFKIEYANKAIERLFMVKPDAMINKRLSEIPAKMNVSQLIQSSIRVVEQNTKDEFETLYRRNNTEKWFYVLLAKMEDGITATFHDISVLKKIEDELKSNIRKLEHSNKELEQYAYAASHDLQEPLRKMQMYASHLQDTQEAKLDERGRNDIQRILRSAQRMSVLIRDILGFSSLTEETIFEETDLNLVLKNVLDDLEVLVRQKGAQVEAASLPVIEAIPLQMNQLFYNLLNNALKFSADGKPPQIKISGTVLSDTETKEYENLNSLAAYCRLEFSDNGIGFEEDFSEQIFGLFKRLGNQNKISGSGIGLALCRKVVDNHSGIIYANGKINEGATFTILLPVKKTPVDEIRELVEKN
jgi:signal transduction histidine kinase/CHASE3 domain sensor protein